MLLSLFGNPTRAMFKFIKRMFGRSDTAIAVPESSVAAPAAITPPRPAEKPAGGVEVAPLSLRAILEKLPADLKASINQLPDPETKIVLPINTIIKQLAGGSVRMSFASLFRQSPPGTFRKSSADDKLMVEVPLSEIFKTLDPSRLNRRSGQRQYDVPAEVAGLFENNPRVPAPGQVRPAVAPVPGISEPVQPPAGIESRTAAAPQTEPASVAAAPAKLRMPGIPPAAPAASAVPANGNGRHGVPPAPAIPATPRHEAAAKPRGSEAGGQLVLPLVELAS